SSSTCDDDEGGPDGGGHGGNNNANSGEEHGQSNSGYSTASLGSVYEDEEVGFGDVANTKANGGGEHGQSNSGHSADSLSSADEYEEGPDGGGHGRNTTTNGGGEHNQNNTGHITDSLNIADEEGEQPIDGVHSGITNTNGNGDLGQSSSGQSSDNPGRADEEEEGQIEGTQGGNINDNEEQDENNGQLLNVENVREVHEQVLTTPTYNNIWFKSVVPVGGDVGAQHAGLTTQKAFEEMNSIISESSTVAIGIAAAVGVGGIFAVVGRHLYKRMTNKVSYQAQSPTSSQSDLVNENSDGDVESAEKNDNGATGADEIKDLYKDHGFHCSSIPVVNI
uniref:Uncharacterized transmembrane protein DDB_G0289901-like n=1 Tax=Saccoglossus kowalevskii TaxID=10224 RepID=A0ABM0MDC8_SACKO